MKNVILALSMTLSLIACEQADVDALQNSTGYGHEVTCGAETQAQFLDRVDTNLVVGETTLIQSFILMGAAINSINEGEIWEWEYGVLNDSTSECQSIFLRFDTGLFDGVAYSSQF